MVTECFDMIVPSSVEYLLSCYSCYKCSVLLPLNLALKWRVIISHIKGKRKVVPVHTMKTYGGVEV